MEKKKCDICKKKHLPKNINRITVAADPADSAYIVGSTQSIVLLICDKCKDSMLEDYS